MRETARVACLNGRRTLILAYHRLALIVDGEPDSPSWQISQNDGTKTSVHAAQALVSPYHGRSANQAIVHASLALLCCETALGLKLCLDDIEWAGDHARSKSSYGTGQGVELGVRGAGSPALEGGEGR